ncbi:MAG: hypothetical protein ACI8Q9_000780 [Planctomycetota bacterium]|jgi:hypothetical protein
MGDWSSTSGPSQPSLTVSGTPKDAETAIPYAWGMIKACLLIASLALSIGCSQTAAPTVQAQVVQPSPGRWLPVALSEIKVADYKLNGDLSFLPAVVKQRVEQIFEQSREGFENWVKPEDMLVLYTSEVLQRCYVVAKGRPGLQLFVADVPRPAGQAPRHALFLYDPVQEKTGTAHIFIDEWLRGDNVSMRMADLELDGVQEVVYRDFMHNGTASDIDQDVYLALDDNLGLTEVLRLDIFARDDISEGSAGTDACRLMRNLDSSGCELKIETWKQNIHYGLAPVDLGSLPLTYSVGSGRWETPE